MDFTQCINAQENILMEGALGERLKHEYGLPFHPSVDMAAFIYDVAGARALRSLWREYALIAQKYSMPFLATTPTRRANRDRVLQAGYGENILADNVKFLRSVQEELHTEMYVGGMIGCKGDAYTGEGCLTKEAGKAFHQWQVDLFQQAGVDFIYAALIPTLEESVGLAQAVSETELPYIISFTIEGDGALIDGTTVTDAILQIDGQVERPPVCYMANCVHPSIVYEALTQPVNQTSTVASRFCGVQGNTAALAYRALERATSRDYSSPEAFAEDMLRLKECCNMKIWGGCCGTDGRYMEQLARRLCAVSK